MWHFYYRNNRNYSRGCTSRWGKSWMVRGREDAGVRRVRYCRESGHGRQDRRKGPPHNATESDGQALLIRAAAGDTAEGTGVRETTGASATPRRKTRIAPATVAESRRQRTAARCCLQ